MNMHPDILNDLAVLYQAGEASPATRELLEREALSNPELARQLMPAKDLAKIEIQTPDAQRRALKSNRPLEPALHQFYRRGDRLHAASLLDCGSPWGGDILHAARRSGDCNREPLNRHRQCRCRLALPPIAQVALTKLKRPWKQVPSSETAVTARWTIPKRRQ